MTRKGHWACIYAPTQEKHRKEKKVKWIDRKERKAKWIDRNEGKVKWIER